MCPALRDYRQTAAAWLSIRARCPRRGALLFRNSRDRPRALPQVLHGTPRPQGGTTGGRKEVRRRNLGAAEGRTLRPAARTELVSPGIEVRGPIRARGGPRPHRLPRRGCSEDVRGPRGEGCRANPDHPRGDRWLDGVRQGPRRQLDRNLHAHDSGLVRSFERVQGSNPSPGGLRGLRVRRPAIPAHEKLVGGDPNVVLSALPAPHAPETRRDFRQDVGWELLLFHDLSRAQVKSISEDREGNNRGNRQGNPEDAGDVRAPKGRED